MILGQKIKEGEIKFPFSLSYLNTAKDINMGGGGALADFALKYAIS